MNSKELDGFLATERTCRVASVGATGLPHVSPLWFLWHAQRLWLYSIVNSQRWKDIAQNPNVSVVTDAGSEYRALRGVEIRGRATVVGDIPRTDGANAELAEPERLFARKYFGVDDFVGDGRHAWLRVDPTKVVSWDFRKLAALGVSDDPRRS